jgi:hypothetical protein
MATPPTNFSARKSKRSSPKSRVGRVSDPPFANPAPLALLLSMNLKKTLALLCLAALSLAATGCTSAELTRVKPWERAALADYTMNPGRDRLSTTFSEHTFFSRETATGGRGVGGSGCGCN